MPSDTPIRAAEPGPELLPNPPRPEMPPPRPAAPDIQPGQATPEEVPQLPDPDVGTPMPEQVPTPRPDLVPPPSPPSPGGVPVMVVAALLAGLALGGRAGPAWAQQAQESPLSPTPPEVQDGRPPVGATGSGETLSEELSRSEGVIVPDQSTTDPGIVRPVPDAGTATMRVIPPPGSPGGDPDVRPK